MTTHAEIEARLKLAYAVTPPEDGLRFLDQRVSRLLAQGATAQPRRGSVAMLLRPLAFVAMFAILATGVGAAVGLLERTIDGSAVPGWRVAWDRAQVLGLQQTDAGITLSLERAYADLNQVLVGFTVDGLPPAPLAGTDGEESVDWVAQLTDPSGRTAEEWAIGTHAMAREETGLSAIVQTWQGSPATDAGTWELRVSSVGYGGSFVPGACTDGSTDPACANPSAASMVQGSWVFRFDLPAAAGTALGPNVSATAAGATVTLTEIRISPTEITTRLGLKVDGTTVAAWDAPDYRITAAGGAVSHVANAADHLTRSPADRGPAGDENRFISNTGSDAAGDTWVVEIPELTYWMVGAAPEEGATITGPWSLEVTIP